MEIDGKLIGKNAPCYFIADIAANHDGELSRAIDLIWKAADSGANAAKFQHFTAKSIVSDFGFKNLEKKSSHQAKWNKSVYDTYADAALELDWTPILRDECAKAGISFFTSPYSIELVDAVDPYVPAFKIGSGDITWHGIIKHIASKGKPYILATGASNMHEVEAAVEVAKPINSQLAILQCNTNYTGNIENMRFIQLNVLKEYRKKFPDLILGLSDHTPGHATVLGAVALGGKIVEKHFTDDAKRTGPDHAFSMTPQSWSDMVERTRELEAALGTSEKKIESNETETVVLQRRAIRLKKTMNSGDKITSEATEFLRPCPTGAYAPNDLDQLIGKRVLKGKAIGDCLFPEDVEAS